MFDITNEMPMVSSGLGNVWKAALVGAVAAMTMEAVLFTTIGRGSVTRGDLLAHIKERHELDTVVFLELEKHADLMASLTLRLNETLDVFMASEDDEDTEDGEEEEEESHEDGDEV